MGLLRNPWWVLAGLVMALLLIHVPTLGTAPLAGTEGHRVITAHQMLERGEFVVPKLYDFVYLYKPPLYYWLLAGFEWAFGASTWVWRMPSVLSHVVCLVAVFLFARRWFGDLTACVAGVCFLVMIPQWAEARSADIDPVNAAVSTLLALTGLEILLGREKSAAERLAWAVLAGAAFGAGLLLKLPAILPPMVIPLAGALLVRRTWRVLLRWELPVAGALGVAMFLGWAIPLKLATTGLHGRSDAAGVSEGAGNLLPHSMSDALGSISVPLTLMVFAFPVSLGMVFAFHRAIWGRRGVTGSIEERIIALATGVLGAWLMYALSGIGWVPRYGYVTLPVVALVAGAVFARLRREPGGDRLVFFLLAASLIAMLVAQGVLTVQIRRVKLMGGVPVEVWAAMGASLILVVVGLRWLLQSQSRAGDRASREVNVLTYVVLVAVMTGVSFAEYSDRRRTMRSGIHLAETLRKEIPAGASVTTSAFLLDQPEVLWYLNRGERAERGAAGGRGRYRIHTLDQFAIREGRGFAADAVEGSASEPRWYLLNKVETKAADQLPASRVLIRRQYKSNTDVVTLLQVAPEVGGETPRAPMTVPAGDK